jgi:hypothetical protein
LTKSQAKNLAKARAAKAEGVAQRRDALKERVEEILASPRVNKELKLKLEYCQRAVDLGRKYSGDLGLMSTRRDELIREAERYAPKIVA